MNEIVQQVSEILSNLNWLMGPHDSFVELIEIKGKIVVISCTGYCAECETDCIRAAFKERMPDIELIIH